LYHDTDPRGAQGAAVVQRKDNGRMSDTIVAAHEAPKAGGQPYFSDAEWQALRQEDIHAGKAVVGLMVGIFTTGLLLYIGVALSVGL
jgi:hypothetical protein